MTFKQTSKLAHTHTHTHAHTESLIQKKSIFFLNIYTRTYTRAHMYTQINNLSFEWYYIVPVGSKRLNPILIIVYIA